MNIDLTAKLIFQEKPKKKKKKKKKKPKTTTTIKPTLQLSQTFLSL